MKKLLNDEYELMQKKHFLLNETIIPLLGPEQAQKMNRLPTVLWH
jgi:hypothetical protein